MSKCHKPPERGGWDAVFGQFLARALSRFDRQRRVNDNRSRDSGQQMRWRIASDKTAGSISAPGALGDAEGCAIEAAGLDAVFNDPLPGCRCGLGACGVCGSGQQTDPE